jgi:hypothetical protein
MLTKVILLYSMAAAVVFSVGQRTMKPVDIFLEVAFEQVSKALIRFLQESTNSVKTRLGIDLEEDEEKKLQESNSSPEELDSSYRTDYLRYLENLEAMLGDVLEKLSSDRSRVSRMRLAINYLEAWWTLSYGILIVGFEHLRLTTKKSVRKKLNDSSKPEKHVTTE